MLWLLKIVDGLIESFLKGLLMWLGIVVLLAGLVCYPLYQLLTTGHITAFVAANCAAALLTLITLVRAPVYTMIMIWFAIWFGAFLAEGGVKPGEWGYDHGLFYVGYLTVLLLGHVQRYIRLTFKEDRDRNLLAEIMKRDERGRRRRYRANARMRQILATGEVLPPV